MFRNILSFCMAVAISLVFQFHTLFAGNAVKFEIEAPAEAKLGEAIDVTVKAIDSEGSVDESYRGSIMFTTSYIGDTVPRPGRTIKFEAENAGVLKFSKGITFKKIASDRELSVNSAGDADISGTVKITVKERTDATNSEGVEVKILTPQMNGEIKSSLVTVSGQTRKNSKVRIILNGKEQKIVIADQAGTFVHPLSDITLKNNVLKAEVLDAENKVIGSSPEVKFVKSKDLISFYGISISPDVSLTGSQDMKINVRAMPGLSKVIATLDEAAIPLKESAPGTYTQTLKAPSKSGSYLIDVALTSETGKQFEKKAATKITIVDPVKIIPPKPDPEPAPVPPAPAPELAKFTNIKTQTHNNIGKVVFTFGLENTPKNLGFFKINYGKTADALMGEVVTHSVETIKKGDRYSWYVPNLREGDYVFKIVALDSNKEPIDKVESELINASIGKDDCTISNVGPISVETNQTKSILSWDPIKNAVAYKLYKLSPDGTYTLFKKTVDPTYTLFLSKGSIQYDDFVVKGVCSDGTESKDYSDAAKVQTGPGALAFIVIVSAFLGFMLLRRRKI